jgi:hypothetical protein
MKLAEDGVDGRSGWWVAERERERDFFLGQRASIAALILPG